MAIITGTPLNDTLLGTDLADNISGDAGNDTLYGYAGNDTLNGDTGNDLMAGDGGYDTLVGRVGNDTLLGGSGDDSLDGGEDADTLKGNDGIDYLNGGTGNDLMEGGLGNDHYMVDSLGDTVIEQSSDGSFDVVNPSINNYTLPANVEGLGLIGGPSSSAVNATGNNLDNIIEGNDFNNSLSGASGNDTLIGAMGRDTLTGGTGKDAFDFNGLAEGIDTIRDFAVSDDVFLIYAPGFGGGLAPGTLKADQFRIGLGAQDSSDRFIYDRSTGALYFDKDGIGGAAQARFAKLSAGLAMTNQDFYVGPTDM